MKPKCLLTRHTGREGRCLGNQSKASFLKQALPRLLDLHSLGFLPPSHPTWLCRPLLFLLRSSETRLGPLMFSHRNLSLSALNYYFGCNSSFALKAPSLPFPDETSPQPVSYMTVAFGCLTLLRLHLTEKEARNLYWTQPANTHNCLFLLIKGQILFISKSHIKKPSLGILPFCYF